MRKLRLILLTILTALWVAASMDPQFSAPTELNPGKEASTLLSATGPASQGPGNDEPFRLDASVRWLNRRPASQLRQDAVDLCVPVSRRNGVAIVPTDSLASPQAVEEFPAHSWQFQLRAALEPRAPSIS